jgi:hypothetical protein
MGRVTTRERGIPHANERAGALDDIPVLQGAGSKRAQGYPLTCVAAPAVDCVVDA